MAILSGKDGTVYSGGTPLVPVCGWRLTLKCETFAYLAGDSGGAVARLAGPTDCEGILEVALEENTPCPLEPGRNVELQLHVDKTGQNFYEVPAVIEQVELLVELNSDLPLTYEVRFSGNGPLVAHGILQHA